MSSQGNILLACQHMNIWTKRTHLISCATKGIQRKGH